MRRYLGAIEHAWPEPARTEYEIAHIFLIDLVEPHPELISREPHLRFFWSPLAELTTHNLLPPALPALIARLLDGDERAWWATNI